MELRKIHYELAVTDLGLIKLNDLKRNTWNK